MRQLHKQVKQSAGNHGISRRPKPPLDRRLFRSQQAAFVARGVPAEGRDCVALDLQDVGRLRVARGMPY